MAKRGVTFAKIETYMNLEAQGLVTESILRECIKKDIENGVIGRVGAQFFEDDKVLDFARRYGLTREASAGGGVGAPRGVISKALQEQYPELVAKVKELEAKTEGGIIVTVEGEEVLVAYQPYWRRIVPEEASVEGESNI